MAVNFMQKQFKILIIGDEGIGKTSLLKRNLKVRFEEQTKLDIGVNLQLESINLAQLYAIEGEAIVDENVSSKIIINYHFWDLGGKKMFDQLRTAYFQGTNGIMLCVNLEEGLSIESIENFSKFLRNISDKHIGRLIPILIVGTKKDKILLEEDPDKNAIFLTLPSNLLREREFAIVSNVELPNEPVLLKIKEAQESYQVVEAILEKLEENEGGGISNIEPLPHGAENKLWITTSAKKGENVTKAFRLIERAVLEQRHRRFESPHPYIYYPPGSKGPMAPAAVGIVYKTPEIVEEEEENN